MIPEKLSQINLHDRDVSIEELMEARNISEEEAGKIVDQAIYDSLQGKPEDSGYCPACKDETLTIRIENSGQSYSSEFGSYHWFDGYAKCSHCGYVGFYSDASI